jgi:hypothetical protein
MPGLVETMQRTAGSVAFHTLTIPTLRYVLKFHFGDAVKGLSTMKKGELVAEVRTRFKQRGLNYRSFHWGFGGSARSKRDCISHDGGRLTRPWQPFLTIDRILFSCSCRLSLLLLSVFWLPSSLQGKFSLLLARPYRYCSFLLVRACILLYYYFYRCWESCNLSLCLPCMSYTLQGNSFFPSCLSFCAAFIAT